MADGIDINTVRHSLYAVEAFGHSTTHSLSVVLFLRFAGAESYESVVKSMEKLVIRMFGVGGARRDTKRSQFESLSRALFWASRDDITEVFSEESSIISRIENDVERYGMEGTKDDIDQILEFIEE